MALEHTRVPVVNVSGAILSPRTPQVTVDNVAVGRLAAEHLLACGFRRLAFWEVPLPHARQRMDGFVEAAREGGAQVVSFFNKAADVGEALDRMPKPIGIMAHNDQQAAHLTAYCAQRRIPVPDQVAVVGVDNDASVCEITSPALSSVEPSSERIGYLAARLLDQLMSGEAPPPRPIVVAPRDVVTRGSSDVVTADPDLVTAVRFIREHANEPITAEDVARVALLSRRTLYRRFEAYFGRTVHEELTLARMARAKQMLSDTEMKVSDVAVRCGFRSLPHFTTMFGQVVGMSPTAYRKQFRPA